MAVNTEILSLIASVASAVGGAFAAWAAYRSAASAQASQLSADRTERRVSLRELSSVAGSVLVEDQRIQAKSVAAKRAYKDLFILSESSTNSRLPLYIAGVDEKVQRSSALAQDARELVHEALILVNASAEEIDGVRLRLDQSLSTLRGMREDLDAEHQTTEAQCAERRSNPIR